jgi:hypothetical protein
MAKEPGAAAIATAVPASPASLARVRAKARARFPPYTFSAAVCPAVLLGPGRSIA